MERPHPYTRTPVLSLTVIRLTPYTGPMKTTIDLPDALATEAKRVARERKTTLRELVVNGLRLELERDRSPRPDFAFPLADGRGVSPDLEASDVITRAARKPS